VKVAAPKPAPVAAVPKMVVKPMGIVNPAFDKLLPDTLQELPTNAPAAGNAGLFDTMVPMGLSPPASDNVAASSSDPFAELLPEGLKVLNSD